jgi:hypothetical protein
MPAQYGRCDREIKCGHHEKPVSTEDVKKSSYSARKNLSIRNNVKGNRKIYIPPKVFERTKHSTELNQFYNNLIKNVPFPFDGNYVKDVLKYYEVGTVDFLSDYEGAVCFPFIDIESQIHGVQVKTFDNANHTTDTKSLNYLLQKKFKRINHPIPKWLHEYQEQSGKYTCLFGEHLLKSFPNNPIAIVEAPKTAIYASLYFGMPKNSSDFLWLATGSLSYLTKDRILVLKDRSVMLFPDLSEDKTAFNKWKVKAETILKEIPSINIQTSNFLEVRASKEEQIKGLDLADFLIQLDWRVFQNELKKDISAKKPIHSKYIPTNKYVSTLRFENGLLMTKGYPAEWDIHAPYLTLECRKLIEQIVKTPTMLKLIQTADLQF